MSTDTAWSRQYERRAVILLALGFGLVGLDRWIIPPLFPAMMEDLGLDYQDLGNIVGVLGLAWGASALLMGGLSDRLGRRRILIPSLITFSVCSALTGLAGGMASLIVIRIIMGITEGAFSPTAVAATTEASSPQRRGLNIGIQQSTFALFGIGLGPIIATQLLLVLPSWHWVFLMTMLPGLVLAYLMSRILREPHQLPAVQTAVSEHAGDQVRWRDVFRYHNIRLAIPALCGAMTCIFVLSAMVPSYLADFHGIGMTRIDLIASGIGFGAFAGQLTILGLSDRFGRKSAVIAALSVSIALLVVFILQGPNIVMLFLLLFFIAFGANGCLALLGGPITVESVPPGLMAAAVGTVMGIGEIFGGGVAPALAGFLAQHYGLQYALYLALAGLLMCLLVTAFLRETAPGKLARRQAEQPLALAKQR